MIVHQPECEQMPSGLAVEKSDHPLGVSPGFLGIPMIYVCPMHLPFESV